MEKAIYLLFILISVSFITLVSSNSSLKLNCESLKDKSSWEKIGVSLPNYDIQELSEKTKQNPIWVHFGIGNIFRIFIGGIADQLISEKYLDKGITCIETFDYEVVDKIYKPFDNLALAVTLYEDGKQEKKIIGSLTEAIKAPQENERLKQIFTNPGLQLISFTITEKGYVLHDSEGNYFPFVKSDIENGPGKSIGVMGIVTSMLYERYKAGKYPLALLSMDNVSQNGKKLQDWYRSHVSNEGWFEECVVRLYCRGTERLLVFLSAVHRTGLSDSIRWWQGAELLRTHRQLSGDTEKEWTATHRNWCEE